MSIEKRPVVEGLVVGPLDGRLGLQQAAHVAHQSVRVTGHESEKI